MDLWMRNVRITIGPSKVYDPNAQSPLTTMSVSPAPDPGLPKWAAEPADYSSPPNSASLEKDEGNVGEDETEMDPPDARSFRGLAARLNYLAQDSPELQFPS